MKYKQTLSTLGWSFVGIIVSYSIIKSNPASLFGWPLLILSCLMIPLSVKYYLKEKKIGPNRKRK